MLKISDSKIVESSAIPEESSEIAFHEVEKSMEQNQRGSLAKLPWMRLAFLLTFIAMIKVRRKY